MKRLFAILIAALLLSAFAGCGTQTPEGTEPPAGMPVTTDAALSSELALDLPAEPETEPALASVNSTKAPESSAMIWPVPSCWTIAVAFGEGSNASHTGIDISDGNSNGKIVVAAAKGTVIYADASAGSYGLQVLIEHGDGIMTRYAHLMSGSVSVEDGDTVEAGQPIARVGSTGNAASPHLHFEVIDIATGNRLNPLEYVRP